MSNIDIEKQKRCYTTYTMKKNSLFREQVLDVVRSIPRGSVMSYGQVAEVAGHPGASRAVGTLMKSNFDPTVPCHRVVKSDGTLGAYNRKGITKKEMLEKEGIFDFTQKNLKRIIEST